MEESKDLILPRANEVSREAWHFYFVRCADRSLYCGISQDTLSRVMNHNKGLGAKWFHRHGPGTIVYTEKFDTFQEARSREAQIKRWSRTKKEKLINGTLASKDPSTRANRPRSG